MTKKGSLRDRVLTAAFPFQIGIEDGDEIWFEKKA